MSLSHIHIIHKCLDELRRERIDKINFACRYFIKIFNFALYKYAEGEREKKEFRIIFLFGPRTFNSLVDAKLRN